MENVRGILFSFLVVCVLWVGGEADVELQKGDQKGAVYEWVGEGKDGSWNNPKNWKVTGSEKGWKYPNEEFKSNYTNQDCVAINIRNGDTVKAYSLAIDGKRDGSTTNVLTIANGSTLKLGNALYIADYENTNGTVNVVGGSVLEVKKLIDIGNWSGPKSKAKLSIIDSKLVVGNFKGYSIRVGLNTTSEMIVSGDSVVSTTGDIHITEGGFDGRLIINGGEVNIGGKIILGLNTTVGKAYIYLNGGQLKAEDLKFGNLKDAKIVYTGGKLMINNRNVSADKMNQLIECGRIDVSGAPNGYKIIDIDGYTSLVPGSEE